MSTDQKQEYRPGETVPQSGIYECDCGDSHRWNSERTSTDVQGHTFPPMPCRGGAWRLQIAAHEE